VNVLSVVLLSAGAIFLIGMLVKIWNTVNQPLPPEKLQKLDRIDSFGQTLSTLSQAVEELRAQLGRDSAFQSHLSRVLSDVGNASAELAKLRGERETDLREFRCQLTEVNQRVGSVLSTLTGRKSGGAAENILREVLRVFPSEWVRAPYYDVEFGFRLFDHRVIPVDSKFAAAELLDRLGQAGDGEREELAEQIERRILSRAREVAKYIDPNSTTTMAICAVPDSAYSLLKRAHLQSYREYRVIIMPYSMTVPVLLAIYDLHLKVVGQMDESRLEAFLVSVEQAVKTLNDTLENKVRDANARLSNAHRECVQAVSVIEGAVAALKSSRLQSLQQATGATHD